MSGGFTIDNFEDALDYIADEIGADFKRTIEITNAILENPSSYTGPQASIAALKLASYRTKIEVVAQYWKQKSTAANGGRAHDRLIKDALMAICVGLQEQINTLKAAARTERELLNGG